MTCGTTPVFISMLLTYGFRKHKPWSIHIRLYLILERVTRGGGNTWLAEEQIQRLMFILWCCWHTVLGSINHDQSTSNFLQARTFENIVIGLILNVAIQFLNILTCRYGNNWDACLNRWSWNTLCLQQHSGKWSSQICTPANPNIRPHIHTLNELECKYLSTVGQYDWVYFLVVCGGY